MDIPPCKPVTNSFRDSILPTTVTVVGIVDIANGAEMIARARHNYERRDGVRRVITGAVIVVCGIAMLMLNNAIQCELACQLKDRNCSK